MHWLLAAVLFLAVPCGSARCQQWPAYGGDPGGAKYSPLDQIDRRNVARLKPAWIFHTGDISDGTSWPTRSAFETTPLVVDGGMYLTTPFSRLIALDPETGAERWSFDPGLDRGAAANLFINRGAAWWSGAGRRRLLLGTLDGRLFSIVAETGKPDEAFGTGGWIDLRAGVADSYAGRGFGMTSPPAVWRDLVVCGSLVPDGEPRGPSGDVRAFDVRTGKLVWTFHTVAREGETGNDTWPKDGWQRRGGLNAWAPLAVDAAKGIIFVPLTSPATDFYGGDRPGANLFGDSLVALDASTGRRLWHFQTVHHDLWDYDLPAQPTLVQVLKNGRVLDAVAQVTKTGFTYLFDRVTGEPVFPIEEAPAPASKVTGEASWPSQPRPVKPPPYARQKFSADELTTVTPESRAYCARLIEGAVFGAIFSPVGFQPTVLFPGTNGGANWGGASFDPQTRTLYVNSMDVGMLYHMVKRPEDEQIPYRAQGSGSINSRFIDPDLYPCQQPPWGFLTAIDLDNGAFRWRSVLGVVDRLIERGVAPTGAPNIGGSLVTAGGLVFIGATNDSRLRAFDKDTGKELWVTRLPASGHATPMTFRGPKSGRQFVVIAAGGGNKYNTTYSDSLVAFTLPGEAPREPAVYYSRAVSRAPVAAQAGNVAAVASAPALFSHLQHRAAKLECGYCHAAAATGERAGFPEAAKCMACHRGVATDRPEIRRLAALPAGEKIASLPPVYRLPDFVFFRHQRHATAGVACAACHGDLWTMDRVEPVLAMKMRACVDCHRNSGAAVTCTACHELSQ